MPTSGPSSGHECLVEAHQRANSRHSSQESIMIRPTKSDTMAENTHNTAVMAAHLPVAWPLSRSECRLRACSVCRPSGRSVCRPSGRSVCRPSGRSVCRPAGRLAIGCSEGRRLGMREAGGNRTAVMGLSGLVLGGVDEGVWVCRTAASSCGHLGARHADGGRLVCHVGGVGCGRRRCRAGRCGCDTPAGDGSPSPAGIFS
jgi:hypothetical protein